MTVCEVDEHVLILKRQGREATITYGGGRARFFRGLARLADWAKKGVLDSCITEHPAFTLNGAMVDMSRNAVMNVETVKVMLRRMALMGMNAYMLYTEDTYEIEGRPYFGYMRGRYTKAELRELDAYALMLGIELVPCIQMLGHLATHLHWDTAFPYRDTANAMLVGADATYALIEDMLKTVTECFTSRRLHMGMDEVRDLGTGRSLAIHGYVDRQELILTHLSKVVEMVRRHGLEPMMWSDMFFRMAGRNIPGYTDYDLRVKFEKSLKDRIPAGVKQVFWDYYHDTEEFYAQNIDKHLDYVCDDLMFAGGVWFWSGHCPLFERSLRFSIPALEACRKKNVREVLATVWHSGSEGSLILSLAGLAWYADYDYRGGYDLDGVKETFTCANGVPYDDLTVCEMPEHPNGGLVSLTRALLYNDPLIGLADKNISSIETHNYYKKVTRAVARVKKNKGIFGPAFDTIYRLSSLLEEKADFGVRLKTAYDAGDREALHTMIGECRVIIRKVKALRRSHRASWMTYNKPFGWEVHDIRYGGLITRFETTVDRLTAYLTGELDRIEELEATREYIHSEAERMEDKFAGTFLALKYASYATANIL
ncbi:MAG: beta-N-acetylhexosaminidase [Clostridia bacterium]|nr:beta-N-acetylhexosaminidase [Clostridia bacterium]